MTELTLTLERAASWQGPSINTIAEWGAIMKLARRASMLATESQRKAGNITDPLDSAILIYTDDPTSAAIFAACPDLHNICKTSHIEGVYCRMDFPLDAFEAERGSDELPRVAAMYSPAIGTKCPRCWNYRTPNGQELCNFCMGWMGQ